MMKIILGAASAMALLLSAQTVNAHDSKPEVTEAYDLSGFDRITIEGVYHIDVQVGEAFSVKTSGSKKEMDKIDIYVEDGALVLGMKDRNGQKNRGHNNHGVDSVITMPALNGMEIAGVASGNVRKISAQSFELEFAGVGELSLSGTCVDLDLEMAGVGELNARKLKCEDVDVDLAGMGEATVYASERVDAQAAGMGQINVYGNPEVVQKSSAFMSKVYIK